MELEPKEAHSCFHCSAKLNITTYFSSGLGKQYSDSEATRVCTWDKCKNQNGCCANSSYTLKEWSQDADNEDEKEIQDINMTKITIIGVSLALVLLWLLLETELFRMGDKSHKEQLHLCYGRNR